MTALPHSTPNSPTNTTTAKAPARQTVFLTGGSGFLGQRIVHRLLQDGHAVQALARSQGSAQALRQQGAIVVPGDLNDAAQLDLAQVDTVVHAAAPVVFWAPWSLYQRDMVDASVAIYRRAAAQGVRRFVYLSSESVLQGRAPLLDIDAGQPFADPPNSDYGRAKKAAELALQAAWRDTPQCALLILRPTFIWGDATPALQTVREKIHSGQFAWIDGGRRPFEAVHVDNVAQAVACALHRGQAGRAYLVTDRQPYSARSLLGALLGAGPQAVAVPNRSLPSWLVMPLARAVEAVWRRLGLWHRAPPLSVFDVAFLAQARRYNIDTTVDELGYAPLRHVPGTHSQH